MGSCTKCMPTIWVQNFVRLKFRVFTETSLLLNFEGFNFHRFFVGVITTPFFGLVVRWYSWISEQVMAKENNTQSFYSVVSGWAKVTKERHS